MKRKLLCLLLTLALAVPAIAVPVLAEGIGTEYSQQTALLKDALVLVIGTPNALSNLQNKQVDPENPQVLPAIINDRTLVPARFIAESLGAQVGWDGETSTVTIQLDGKIITMVLNSTAMVVDGQEVTLEVPAQSIEGRTMVPLRALCEQALAKQVFWDPKGLIVISNTENIFDSTADAGFIDSLIAAVKAGEAIELSGPIFDTQDVDDVVDYDKVEEPYYVRGGIPNFHAKVDDKSVEEIKIAYIGGSITEGYGYRDLSNDWFADKYGDRFDSKNAGVGGTPSDFGAVRFATDIIPYDPDLLFIEFAVNDGELTSRAIAQSMEGMVRQAWQHNPNMDIVFVYTMNESQIETAAEGKYSRTAKIHDYVAQHYNIPSIFMGYDVAKQAQNGEIIFNGSNPGDSTGTVFSGDGVHPNSDGSQMYMDMLERAYKDLLKKEAPNGAMEHELVEPLFTNNWGNLKTYEPDDPMLILDGFSKMDSASTGIRNIWGNRANYAMNATEVGDSMTVNFTGTQAGILYLPGPDAPNIDIVVDGELIEDKCLFDVWHGVTGYTILYYMTPELEYGDHTVSFTINDTEADKRQMILDSNYNVTAGLNTLMKNEDWFASKNFIVGKVLVNGELKK